MTEPQSPMSEYDRGHIAGRIEERLTRTESHLKAINGSMAEVAKELTKLTLAVQALRDEQATTARVLREANTAQRETSAVRWSPWAKLLAVAGGFAALAVVISAIASWGQP